MVFTNPYYCFAPEPAIIWKPYNKIYIRNTEKSQYFFSLFFDYSYFYIFSTLETVLFMRAIHILFCLLLWQIIPKKLLAQSEGVSDTLIVSTQIPAIGSNDSLPILDKKETTGFAAFHIGAGINEFSKINNSMLDPFSKTTKKSFRAGFTVCFVNKRFYQNRLELGYTFKRVVQDFQSKDVLISSDANFHSAQGTFLPIVIKGGTQKLGAFIGVGGYGTYHLSQNVKYTSEGKELKFYSNPNKDKVFSDYDYGIIISGGIYFNKRMIELRIENGLNKLLEYGDGSSLYNRSLNLILHL